MVGVHHANMKKVYAYGLIVLVGVVFVTVLAGRLLTNGQRQYESAHWTRPKGDYWNVPGASDFTGVEVRRIPNEKADGAMGPLALRNRQQRLEAFNRFNSSIIQAEEFANSTPIKLKAIRYSSTSKSGSGLSLSDLSAASQWLCFAAFCSLDQGDFAEASRYFDLSLKLQNDMKSRNLSEIYWEGRNGFNFLYNLTITYLSEENDTKVARDLIRKYVLGLSNPQGIETKQMLIDWGETRYYYSFDQGQANQIYKRFYKGWKLPMPPFPEVEAMAEIDRVVGALILEERKFQDGSFEEIVGLSKLNENIVKSEHSLLIPSSVARVSTNMVYNGFSQFSLKFEFIAFLNYLDYMDWIEAHPGEEEKWIPNFEKYGYPYKFGYYWNRPERVLSNHGTVEKFGGMYFETFGFAPQPFEKMLHDRVVYPFIGSDPIRLFGTGGSSVTRGVRFEHNGVSGPFMNSSR